MNGEEDTHDGLLLLTIIAPCRSRLGGREMYTGRSTLQAGTVIGIVIETEIMSESEAMIVPDLVIENETTIMTVVGIEIGIEIGILADTMIGIEMGMPHMVVANLTIMGFEPTARQVATEIQVVTKVDIATETGNGRTIHMSVVHIGEEIGKHLHLWIIPHLHIPIYRKDHIVSLATDVIDVV